ncbi:hypothetical protein BV25DRAFT_167300 [Artomyces pyxidatus]|uniref:Uncharacterized protein n=1 Tax=Artomyces pyxidatus TaxID=48021 RepID=A0ACB8SGA2_9AGAM|nr:hypothetical protein BV25DRAFT_167300 [Artomyces pyxidatus]
MNSFTVLWALTTLPLAAHVEVTRGPVKELTALGLEIPFLCVQRLICKPCSCPYHFSPSFFPASVACGTPSPRLTPSFIDSKTVMAYFLVSGERCSL